VESQQLNIQLSQKLYHNLMTKINEYAKTLKIFQRMQDLGIQNEETSRILKSKKRVLPRKLSS
jgi:alcohol dehydrogenase YqhD (iron-dependent ADH family)